MKCNYPINVLKAKCPFYFGKDCTLKKLKTDKKACFFKNTMVKKEKTND